MKTEYFGVFIIYKDNVLFICAYRGGAVIWNFGKSRRRLRRKFSALLL